MSTYDTAQPWLNSDGLIVKFGASEADQGRAGEYRQTGPYHLTECVIPDMTKLTTSNVILDDMTVIPNGAIIDKVEVLTEVAVTGSSAVMNVGLMYDEDRTTLISATALVAAIPTTQMSAAADLVTSTAGSTYAGASIGATLTKNGLFCANYATAAFTAGKVFIRVYWRMPVTY